VPIVSDPTGDTASDPALTPDLALAYLGELSTDIRASAVLDGAGSVAAQSGFDTANAEQVQALVGDLFDSAGEAAGDDPAPDQVEVSLPDGSVFAVRDSGWTLAVVAGRFALSSLMFFDLRMVIRDLTADGTAP
jgi:predicted regulator of Ras-like GTPase activity (Roadblock/LC7/MglB family)